VEGEFEDADKEDWSTGGSVVEIERFSVPEVRLEDTQEELKEN